MISYIRATGEMAERSNAAVLKTVEQQCSGGSNPSLSALQGLNDTCRSNPFFMRLYPVYADKEDQQVYGK